MKYYTLIKRTTILIAFAITTIKLISLNNIEIRTGTAEVITEAGARADIRRNVSKNVVNTALNENTTNENKELPKEHIELSQEDYNYIMNNIENYIEVNKLKWDNIASTVDTTAKSYTDKDKSKVKKKNNKVKKKNSKTNKGKSKAENKNNKGDTKKKNNLNEIYYIQQIFMNNKIFVQLTQNNKMICIIGDTQGNVSELKDYKEQMLNQYKNKETLDDIMINDIVNNINEYDELKYITNKHEVKVEYAELGKSSLDSDDNDRVIMKLITKDNEYIHIVVYTVNYSIEKIIIV